MERYTQQQNGIWGLRGGSDTLPQALERLSKCENLLADLEEERQDLTQRMETLRAQGKNKTVQFKELMARNLVNQQLRLRLEQYGLP